MNIPLPEISNLGLKSQAAIHSSLIIPHSSFLWNASAIGACIEFEVDVL
jgi:hypothetical protein